MGFHICRNEHNHCGHHMWRKGTLHAGVLDVQVGFFLLWGRYRGVALPKEEFATSASCSTCTARWCIHGIDCNALGVCALPPTFFAVSKTTLVGVSRVASPQVPLAALKEKAKLYVDQGLIRQEMAERVVKVIESERGDSFIVNDVQPGDVQDAAAGGGDSLSTRLSPEQMQALLAKRVEMMKQGQVRDDGGMDAAVTDQYRVYS